MRGSTRFLMLTYWRIKQSETQVDHPKLASPWACFANLHIIIIIICFLAVCNFQEDRLLQGSSARRFSLAPHYDGTALSVVSKWWRLSWWLFQLKVLSLLKFCPQTFETEKQTPQTFSLLGCLGGRDMAARFHFSPGWDLENSTFWEKSNICFNFPTKQGWPSFQGWWWAWGSVETPRWSGSKGGSY